MAFRFQSRCGSSRLRLAFTASHRRCEYVFRLPNASVPKMDFVQLFCPGPQAMQSKAFRSTRFGAARICPSRSSCVKLLFIASFLASPADPYLRQNVARSHCFFFSPGVGPPFLRAAFVLCTAELPNIRQPKRVRRFA